MHRSNCTALDNMLQICSTNKVKVHPRPWTWYILFSFLDFSLTNYLRFTARLKMRMLVVFLIVLLRRTTRTTRRLPTRPITMTKVKRMGTMMGTIVIRVFSCSKSTSSSSSSPSSAIIELFIPTILQLSVQNFRKSFISEIFLEFLAPPQTWITPTEIRYLRNFLTKLLPKLAFSENKPPTNS